MSVKVFVVAAALVASGGAAQAGPLDVLNTVGNIAGAVSDTQRSLAEGKVPDVPHLGGKSGGHGSGGKHASGGGHKHK